MRVVPAPGPHAVKPALVERALRVRPMPGLAWLMAMVVAGSAAADPTPNTGGWHAKGKKPGAAATEARVSAIESAGHVRRVTLNASPSTTTGAKTSLSWRRPTDASASGDRSADLGPKLLSPGVVTNARRVSAEEESSAPQLIGPKTGDDPFEHWGHDVIEAQRLAAAQEEGSTPPFGEEGNPPGEPASPGGEAAPADGFENHSQETPGRFPSRGAVRGFQRQITQLPPCPRPEDLRKISEITDDITPPGTEFPPECEIGQGVFEPRSWAETTYTWKASGLCHKPLYFEDVQLERYGHTCGPILQPFLSGAHFFGNALILPYKMGMEPPCECVYALGYYRPGNCAPFMIQPLGLSWQGAFWQGATVTGLVFLIP